MMDSKVFQALSDVTRLRILELLSKNGSMNVTSLTKHLGCLQPAVSRHLKVLRDAALIGSQRKGKEVVYSIEPDRLTKAASYLEALGTAARSLPSAEKVTGLVRKPRQRRAGKSQKRVRRGPVDQGEEFEFARKPEEMDDFLL